MATVTAVQSSTRFPYCRWPPCPVPGQCLNLTIGSVKPSRLQDKVVGQQQCWPIIVIVDDVVMASVHVVQGHRRLRSFAPVLTLASSYVLQMAGIHVLILPVVLVEGLT